MTVTLEHIDGTVLITQLSGKRCLVKVTPAEPGIFLPRTECETTYDLELLKQILDVKGLVWLCDEIARDEDDYYVGKLLKNELKSYFIPDDFVNKRILDFGCGGGASTMWLAKMFPSCEILGIELDKDLLSIAGARREHYGFENVRFLQSPSGSEIPDNLDNFDLIIMSAVYEHLLPEERGVVLRQLWSLLPHGGYLFLNQTPNRAFPFELHTTGLPLINYLPDILVLQVMRRFSRRVPTDESWEKLLRMGIRGATVREIKRNLSISAGTGEMLEPYAKGIKTRVDLWHMNSNPNRLVMLKRISKLLLNIILALTGVAFIPELSLAFRKECRDS